MDEVISRSVPNFKQDEQQTVPKTTCQRQQICDNVVKVKFWPGLFNETVIIIFRLQIRCWKTRTSAHCPKLFLQIGILRTFRLAMQSFSKDTSVNQQPLMNFQSKIFHTLYESQSSFLKRVAFRNICERVVDFS